MGKRVENVVYDAALNYIKNNCTRVTVCDTEPTNFTEANATYKLADVTVDDGDFTGPADGDVSGRKLTFGAQSDVEVDSAGDATHVAFLDVANSALLFVTTCPTTAIAGTVNIGSLKIEISDPT